MPETLDLLLAPYGTKNGQVNQANPTQQKVLEWVDRIRAMPPENQTHIPVLYIQGGVGCGKTRSFLAVVLELLTEISGLNLLWGRQDFKDLKLSIMNKFFEILPPEIIHSKNETYHWYDIDTPEKPSRIFFNGLKDLTGLGSQEFAVIVINEVHEISEQIYRALKRRCRQEGKPIMILMEGEAPNENHWLARITNPADESYDPDIETWFASTYENWDNLPVAYRGSLESMPESWKSKYLLGKYGFKPDGKPYYSGYKEIIHALELEWLPDRELICGWDFGYHHPACYDKDTQILTKDGWKHFFQLQEGEEVLTYNVNTDGIEYQKTLANIRYKYSGRMFHWQSYRNIACDIRVTANHFMVGYNRHFKKYEFKQAQDIGDNRFNIPTGGRWEGGELKSPVGVLQGNEFAKFMGIWLSEGSLNKQDNHYNIWVWQKENNKVISDLLFSLKIKFHRQEKSEGWCGASKELCLYLEQFGKSGDKFIPKEIKESKVESIKEFIGFYELGDGSKRKGKCILVTTKSKRMADDLQELYAKIGISSRIRQRITDGCYEVRKNSFYTIGLKRKFLKVEDVTDEDVYCVVVPNHTVFVRRGEGRAVFCGNCLVTQIDLQDRWCWLREIIGTDITIDKFAEKVKQEINYYYPNARVSHYGDPACIQKNDKSEFTSWQILASKGIRAMYRQSEYRLRKEIIERKLSTLIAGKPSLLVDRRYCKTANDGFLGGYHYPEYKQDREIIDKFELPFKDGFYEHIMNAGEYIAVNLFSPIETRRGYRKPQVFKSISSL